MKILLNYLKQYKSLVLLALVLATINQGFSMLNPIVLQHIIDNFLMKKDTFTSAEFFHHVLNWIGLSMCFAMASRIAKNFQDYFTNVVTQKVGVQIYTDGLKHSLELPYAVFEDQRSGETLGKIQKVRDDIQKFVLQFISIVFTTLVGVVFIVIYSVQTYWAIAPVYFLMVPLLGFVSSFLSKQIKGIQK